MTVASQVKGALVTLKGIEATLSTLALQAKEHETQNCYHQASLKTRTVIGEMEKRVAFIESEEPQYKGN
ncbi:DUF1657 domain-containing protein [Halalkalibacter urbisdiaboli]|uniref:DUF1657 domain-containing protein n=1 Tax=Halalkalibacter urbisdiaboli TaxID=1960589 RepID=UPI000B42F5FA|nr:DUF1657 domain-containing protein [Halalkalibacter urbisdiaboli]